MFSTAKVVVDDEEDAASFPEALVFDEVEATAQSVRATPSPFLRFGEGAIVAPTGVPGAPAIAMAGVAGKGNHPSFVGRHPDRR